MLRSVLVFALAAMFLGLGLGRFAFSPLIPELVARGWLDAPAAQAVGAANLVGYFVGAVLARPAVRWLGERRLCRIAAGLVVLAAAMALVRLGPGWLWLARFCAGLGGAVLMVVGTTAAAGALLRLGRIGLQPLVFLGIGLGALFAALGLPPLLRHGLEPSLWALTGLSALAALALWLSSGFLGTDRPPPAPARGRSPPGAGVWLILIAYGCDALGFVMHTVFLPDMARRSLGFSEMQVGLCWAAFGIGACAAPGFVMLLRRLVTTGTALWSAFALKALAVALVLVAPAPAGLAVSLLLVGLLTPGIVILTSGALALAAPPDRFLGLWAMGTALFAACQMGAGLTIAAISGQGYGLALELSVAVLALAAALTLIAARRQETPDQRPVGR